MPRWTAPIVIAAMLTAHSFADDAPTIRIMTYNIHHGEGMDGALDLERIAQVILAANPDVVCLQEADRNLPRTNHIDMPARFAELLGMEAVFEANYLFAGGEYGNATLTRLPIINHENLALPGPEGVEPRGCLRVTVSYEGREVAIFNTHWGLRPEERLEQAKATRQFMEGHRHAVLAGDLNAVPGSLPMAVVLEALRDSIEAAPADLPEDQTYTVRNRRIDYILASNRLEPRKAEVIRTEKAKIASDHLPYWAALALPPLEDAR